MIKSKKGIRDKRGLGMGQRREKKPAVFFDRDGTLIQAPGGEPPRTPDEVAFFPTAIETLQRIYDAGYELFLISNQPDFMNGKSTIAELRAVHVRFNNILFESGIHFREYFYCFHRREDTCDCRKPSPYFINFAAKQYDLDLQRSWMIGDRDTDVFCGQNAGVNTILIGAQVDGCVPDYIIPSLWDAGEIIVNGG